MKEGMMIERIGSAAGEIWKKLKEEGEATITKLNKETGLPASLFYMGLGWLSREDKIVFRQEKKNIYISLKG